MGGRELDIEGGSSAPSPFAVLDPVRVLCAQGQGNAPPRPPPGLPPYRGVSSRRAAFMLRFPSAKLSADCQLGKLQAQPISCRLRQNPALEPAVALPAAQ